MGISMELVDEMRRRTNCSYQEARELLTKHNGDLLEAIVEFEKKNGNGRRCGQKVEKTMNQGLCEKIRVLVKKGFKTRFIIEKDEETLLNLSVNVLVIIVLIALPVFWLIPATLIIAYFLGCRFRIKRQKGEDIDVTRVIDDVGGKIKTAVEKRDEKKADKDEERGNKTDDGYNEMTIE